MKGYFFKGTLAMMKIRQANQCGSADYGWLKARYSFSFGHYFDPEFLVLKRFGC